jgi:hypothetical protein
MKLKDFKDLLARVPKEYEIEPMAIITDPINKKIMLMPMGEESSGSPNPQEERKSNPIGFA